MVSIWGDRKHPALRFVFKTNGRISSITSYKDHFCSFFTSWVIKQQKWCILTILKKHPTLGVRYAPMEKVSGLNFGVLKVVIIWMKTGFLNFEDIPFPQKLRVVRLSLKKGKSEWKMLPGTGECHIYVTGLHTMWPSVSTSYFCATVVATLHPGTITEQASRSCLDISYPNWILCA